MGEWPPGCAFAPRCRHREARCDEAVPVLVASAAATRAASGGRRLLPRPTPIESLRARAGCRGLPPLLEVAGLTPATATHGGSRLRCARTSRSRSAAGECVALVGESGSGKTTSRAASPGSTCRRRHDRLDGSPLAGWRADRRPTSAAACRSSSRTRTTRSTRARPSPMIVERPLRVLRASRAGRALAEGR